MIICQYKCANGLSAFFYNTKDLIKVQSCYNKKGPVSPRHLRDFEN